MHPSVILVLVLFIGVGLAAPQGEADKTEKDESQAVSFLKLFLSIDFWKKQLLDG